MARSKAQTRAAGPDEARAYLGKAEEFLRAAKDSLELTNYTAAVGNSVRAGIAAADAISAMRTRTVWRGEHAQAASHLESAGDDGNHAAKHLRRLLPMKTRAEYDPTPMRPTDARTAVQAAERITAIARQTVATAPPS
jgi:HEPN domain-containing protein